MPAFTRLVLSGPRLLPAVPFVPVLASPLRAVELLALLVPFATLPSLYARNPCSIANGSA